jgi:Zn-dependent M28 family amino/carboxypeptidase
LKLVIRQLSRSPLGGAERKTMKRLLYLYFSILCFSVYSTFAGELTADSLRLQSHVNFLTNIQPPRSITHLHSLEQSAQYIESQLRKYSSRIEIQSYSVSYGYVRNVIASFGPENGSRIIVGAHYDVAGDQSGADDNASGIAGLLEVARLLAQDSAKLERRIDLVAYTLEEPPYFRTEQMGSYVHAKSLKDQDVKVDLMVCLEMIGYYSSADGSQSYPIGLMKLVYPTTGDFIAVVSNFSSHFSAGSFVEKMEQKCSVKIERLTAPASVQGVDFSDHLNYWNFGFKAIMITDTAFLRNANYHQKSDTPETLDYATMADVVNGIYYAVSHYHGSPKKYK